MSDMNKLKQERAQAFQDIEAAARFLPEPLQHDLNARLRELVGHITKVREEHQRTRPPRT